MNHFATSMGLAVVLVSAPAVAKPAVVAHYTTASTPIGTLRADPAARAILARRFPMLLKSAAVASGQADRMTLRMLKRFKPEIFTDAALAAADADFARLPHY